MSPLAGAPCLVTGASGFIGSALCRALRVAGAETHGTLRPAGSRWRCASLPSSTILHTVDLGDPHAVRRLLHEVRPRVLFNTACHPSRAYDDSLASVLAADVLTLAHLLDAIRALPEGSAPRPRLVQLGSSLELGPSPTPHRPEDALHPSTLRGASRGAASLVALQQARAGEVPAVVVRPFHVYGPWESPDRLISTAIRAALRGETLPLTAGRFARDPIYVDDVAQGCLAAAVSDRVLGETIHLGSGIGITNQELVTAIERAVGAPIRIERGAFPARAADCPARVADTSLARERLGWTPRTPLDTGLLATVDWMRRELVASP